MSSKPFDIMRWESPQPPTLDFLTRMMTREGLQAESLELPEQTHTPEMKFEQVRMIVLSAGKLQVSFPGYGSVGLAPGDILEINPGVLHDVIVPGTQPATLLQAFK